MKPEEIDRATAEADLKHGQELWAHAGDDAGKYEEANEITRKAEEELAWRGPRRRKRPATKVRSRRPQKQSGTWWIVWLPGLGKMHGGRMVRPAPGAGFVTFVVKKIVVRVEWPLTCVFERALFEWR